MKRLSTLFAILIIAAVSLFAQAPQKFSYQAVVRNANNTLVANTQVGVRVSILQGSATGSAIYSETHIVSSNANGLVTLVIGDGSVINGVFDNIDWVSGPYFLKTEIDPEGGSNYTITSTQQLLSVPYALYAKTAGNAFSGDYNDLTNTPIIPTIPNNVSTFTNDAGYLTSYTETDPTVPTWAKEANKPAYSYSEITNTPTIPTVPTNVSAFTNDAGYLTNYTETDPTVPAWAKEANKPAYNYSEIANTPTIPTVPTNVSAFTNDAGYLTEYTEQQALSISNDTIFLTGGGYVKLPAAAVGFSGDYNDLTNTPDIPTVPTNVGAFTNDAGYLTSYTETDPQFTAWDKDYNDLINKPTIPTIPNNVSTFTNDAGYITAQDLPTIPSVPTNVSAFTNDAGYLSVAQCPDVDICVLMSQLETLQQQVAALQLQVDSLKNVADTSNNQNVPTDTTLIVTFTTANMTEPIIAPNQSEWNVNSFNGIRGWGPDKYYSNRTNLTNNHYMVFDSVDYDSNDNPEHTIVYTTIPCTISEIRLFSPASQGWVDMSAGYSVTSSPDGKTHTIVFIDEIETETMAVKIQRLH